MPEGIRVLYFLNGGASTISKAVHELNEEIRDKEIRLIGDDGEQLGIMSADAALAIADEKGLDLVKISPQATPPVCKLMNDGKFRFEQGKREKAQILSAYKINKFLEEMQEDTCQMWKRIDIAASEYRKAPSVELADKLLEAIYGGVKRKEFTP